MTKTLTVVESFQGKFGPQVKDTEGNFYSFGKFYKGKTDLPPGKYQFDIYTTGKGNSYINAINLWEMPKGETSEPGEEKKENKSKVEEPVLKPRDFDAEARGKTRCALLQAIMPLLVTIESDELPDNVKSLVNSAVEFVFKGETND